jgi:hypothetical protein
MKSRCLVLLVGVSACTHLTPFNPGALSEQTFSIRPGWSMALAMDGSVAGRPAVVRLAVEEPVSRVTQGCFESTPEVLARVDTGSDAGVGRPQIQNEVLAGDVRLGRRLLGDVRALLDPAEGCEMTLGSEVLLAFALEVSPAARTVTFHQKLPATPRFRSEDSLDVELTLDPKTDRPSLAVQLDTAGSPLTLPMVLATAEERVQVSAEAASLLVGNGGPNRLAATALAFAPGWELQHVDVSVLGQSQGEERQGQLDEGLPAISNGVSGVLGAEAWGHYHVLIDLRGRHLVLYRRPPPVEGETGPESWTHLSSDSRPNGSLVRLISWQTLNRGAQLPLEPVYVQLRSCRIGLTLGPEDPGASLEVAIPWPALEKDFPSCAKEVAAVPAWTGDMEVSPTSPPCRGSCVYAQEVSSGHTLCSCSLRRAAFRPTPTPTPPAASDEPAEPQDPAPSKAPKKP